MSTGPTDPVGAGTNQLPPPEPDVTTRRRPRVPLSRARDRPLRVAFVGTRGVPARYGGFETCAEEVSVRLAARGHDVTVYCRRGNVLDEPSEHKGVKLTYTPSIESKALSTISHTAASLASASRRHFDVILAFNAGNAPLFPFARAARQKLVVNVDGLEWKRGKWGRWAKAYYQGAERLSTRSVQRIVVDSVAIGDYYERRWRAASTFIPYGAPLIEPKDPAILERYGLSPQGYVLMASRLEAENNGSLLVDAWPSVGTDKELVIVGSANWDSPYVRSLRRAAAGSRVRFLGAVYEPGHYDELLCGCCVYVHGNEVGGTNPSLLQAMGAGRCVLALDVDFNREVGGEAVLYFRKDSRDLAALLNRVLEDGALVERLGVNARARLAGRYDWDLVADRYEQLLLDVRAGVIGRRSPRD